MNALNGHHNIDSYVFTVTYGAWMCVDNQAHGLGRDGALAFMKISPQTGTIEVPDLKSLTAAWRTYGGPFCMVRHFIVAKPLTASQLSRLPGPLKARLEPDDMVWLERLYRLEDPRG
jgi:hypothetical protein